MGTKSEALAKQLEAKAREALTTLEQLSESEWKKVTAAEKWSVGVTAHHLAGALEAVSGMIKTVAGGEPLDTLTLGMIDEMNAQHAKEFAACTKAETRRAERRSAGEERKGPAADRHCFPFAVVGSTVSGRH